MFAVKTLIRFVIICALLSRWYGGVDAYASQSGRVPDPSDLPANTLRTSTSTPSSSAGAHLAPAFVTSLLLLLGHALRDFHP